MEDHVTVRELVSERKKWRLTIGIEWKPSIAGRSRCVIGGSRPLINKHNSSTWNCNKESSKEVYKRRRVY